MSRVAVITGGASGMGEAICHHLGRRGDRVAVLDIDGDAAERVAKEVQADSARALAFEVDVTDRSGVEDAVDRVRRQLGPVEILVTSAGVPAFEPFTDITLDSWNRILAVNLTGTFNCIQVVIPDMIAARWGRIVTISSSSGQRGAPKMAHYSAAKGGVIALTKTLAREFGPHGITVNNVPPSAIETPMQHRGQAEGNLPPNDVMAQAVPLGHLGTADDIAVACAFLTSDEAGFITGQIVGVNGGSVVV
jgi:2-hydroxycyclohexanecarboxyl-CoA dehydrogenase